MIVRPIGYFVLLAVAIVTASVQFDRQSAIDSRFATITPEPARAFAQAIIAERALVSGSPEDALKETEKLIAQRPIPAEALRLLAQAQSRVGRPEQSLVTIQVAAQRGWRDPVAQEAMLRLAMAAGDEREAVRRWVALFLDRSTNDALLQEAGATLFADPDGEAVILLAEIVSGSERWRRGFAPRAARVLPAAVIARVETEIKRTD